MTDNRPIVKFDTETKSDLSLPDVGRWRYLSHHSADILMFAYRIGSSATKLWLPGDPVPVFFRNTKDFRFAAFNAQFDKLVMNKFAQRYGFGHIEYDQCIDIMAIAARFGLPQSLDKLGMMLRVQLVKMAIGTALKKKICMPPYSYTPDEWDMFQKYCVRDVDSMCEIMDKLPSNCLSPTEQDIWVDTAKINARGVPVDSWSVKQINKIVDYYIETKTGDIPYITSGAVKTVGQIQKIKQWAGTHGVELENLQVQTVTDAVKSLEEKLKDAFEDEAVSAGYLKVHEMLRIRQLIGGSAVKKFKRLLNMAHHDIIHDNLRYHGAGTGRTTGGGFQMLNLPRAKVKPDKDQTYVEAVEVVLQSFFDVSVLDHEDPLLQAKKLVRPMLKAPDEETLMVADWGSIEYILLMYFCEEWDKVEKFRGGNDPYIDFATELFHVNYDDVTDQMRQESKPPVLGSGYMLGSGVPRRDPVGGLIAYALGYGIDMSDEQATFATNTYRSTHQKVVKTWYNLSGCAMNAVRNPDLSYDTNNTSFIVRKDRTNRSWLIMTLPSGRNLYYCEPFIEKKSGKRPTIAHMGVNPYTKHWGKVYLKPQRIIENIIQGLGRDILNNGLRAVQHHGFVPIFHVYDEIGCIGPVEGSHQRLAQMIQLMCISPSWMPTLPLRASGYVSQRYKKD